MNQCHFGPVTIFSIGQLVVIDYFAKYFWIKPMNWKYWSGADICIRKHFQEWCQMSAKLNLRSKNNNNLFDHSRKLTQKFGINDYNMN